LKSNLDCEKETILEAKQTQTAGFPQSIIRKERPRSMLKSERRIRV
jgi:hypothetical protein